MNFYESILDFQVFGCDMFAFLFFIKYSLQMLLGAAIMSSIDDEMGFAFNAEYNHLFFNHIRAALGYLRESTNEVNPQLGEKLNRHDIYGQVQWYSLLNKWFGIAIGLGPTDFISLDDDYYGYLTTTEFSINFAHHQSLYFKWDRTLIFNDIDTDVYLLGLAFRF